MAGPTGILSHRTADPFLGEAFTGRLWKQALREGKQVSDNIKRNAPFMRRGQIKTSERQGTVRVNVGERNDRIMEWKRTSVWRGCCRELFYRLVFQGESMGAVLAPRLIPCGAEAVRGRMVKKLCVRTNLYSREPSFLRSSFQQKGRSKSRASQKRNKGKGKEKQ